MPSRRLLRLAAAPLAAGLLAACGGAQATYQIPAAPPTTAPPSTVARTTAAPRTTVPRASTAPTVPRPSFTDMTGNLTGLPSECGTVSAVWARPDDDRVIAGIAGQGLWVNRTGSDRWEKLGQGPGSAVVDNRAQVFVLDPGDPRTFYESGLYGRGGYVTRDDGQSFQPLGSLTPSDQVAIDFSDPARATMISASHEILQFKRSTDGGRTWSDITGDIPRDAGLARAVALLGPTTYLAGTFRGTATGIFRTTDGGASWTRTFTGTVAGPPLVRADGSIWWVLEGSAGVARSIDGGLTWEPAVRSGILSPVATTLVELPDGRLASYSRTVVVSDDGKRWKSVSGSLPFIPAGMTYSPARKAFILWRADCGDTGIPVAAGSIMQLPFADPA